jgi:hypothetical protein
MNGSHYDNSMDALNLYSERIAQDMSRFTGGARKGEKLSAATKQKIRDAALNRKFLKEVGLEVPPARKRVRKPTKASLEKQARDALNAVLAVQEVAAPVARKRRTRNAPARGTVTAEQRKIDRNIARRSIAALKDRYVKQGISGCVSAIGDSDYNYLCNRIKPRVRKPRSAAGLSGLGYAAGLSGLGYSRASGLSAAGLSAGRVSMAKAAQMERWSDYQNEINSLRNMGHSYRDAQQMAKHILRIY